MSEEQREYIKIEYGIRVLYVDNHILVVCKPPGLLTQADKSGDPDLLSILRKWVARVYNKPGKAFLGMIHRLDRPVGGVVVLARTSKGASRLSRQIRERVFGKTYLAAVQGRVEPRNGAIKHLLVWDKLKNRMVEAASGDQSAKEGRLTYQLLESKKDCSLLRIELETGRRHQIRAQMQLSGHPVLGDHRYFTTHQTDASGKEFSDRKGGMDIGLWASKLCFSHPVKDKKLSFSVLPPLQRLPWKKFDSLA